MELDVMINSVQLTPLIVAEADETWKKSAGNVNRIFSSWGSAPVPESLKDNVAVTLVLKARRSESVILNKAFDTCELSTIWSKVETKAKMAIHPLRRIFASPTTKARGDRRQKKSRFENNESWQPWHGIPHFNPEMHTPGAQMKTSVGANACHHHPPLLCRKRQWI
jgi:hypothetical protein